MPHSTATIASSEGTSPYFVIVTDPGRNYPAFYCAVNTLRPGESKFSKRMTTAFSRRWLELRSGFDAGDSKPTEQDEQQEWDTFAKALWREFECNETVGTEGLNLSETFKVYHETRDHPLTDYEKSELERYRQQDNRTAGQRSLRSRRV